MIGIEPTLGINASNEVELFVILSPCGPYFSTGIKPVNLMADPNYVRAWPGGKYTVIETLPNKFLIVDCRFIAF